MNINELKTCDDMRALSKETQDEMTKAACSGTWHPAWRPYCLQVQVPCDAGLLRMDRTDYGFRCRRCGNIIGFDLKRLRESPLNGPKTV